MSGTYCNGKKFDVGHEFRDTYNTYWKAFIKDVIDQIIALGFVTVEIAKDTPERLERRCGAEKVVQGYVLLPWEEDGEGVNEIESEDEGRGLHHDEKPHELQHCRVLLIGRRPAAHVHHAVVPHRKSSMRSATG